MTQGENPTTFELKIDFNFTDGNVREQVKDWLIDQGEDSFVDGVIDGLNMDFDYMGPPSDEMFSQLGGNVSPIVLYKYQHDRIEYLQSKLHEDFTDLIRTEVSSLDSVAWQEGWKDSFLTVEMGEFRIYPPWLREEQQLDSKLVGIEIDPGMAFGTGQHQTTRLCLKGLSFLDSRSSAPTSALFDVGTGSGILAIAAAKIGYGTVVGSDIDADAIFSARRNVEANGVSISLHEGTTNLGDGQKYHVVIANILAVVIKRIFDDLVNCLLPGGELMLSGILRDDVEEIRNLSLMYGLSLVHVLYEDDWAMMILRKTS